MKYAPLVLCACLILSAVPAGAQPKGQGGPQAPAVVLTPVETDEFVDRVEAIGTLRANESVTLASTVTETVTAVNFQDGQRVKQGDILVEMTRGEEKALLDQQKALVSEAGKQLERARNLAKTGAASTSILEERQRDFTSAKAALAALQSRLNDYIIVAPFDGVLGLRNISVGTLLAPGTTITTLDQDDIMKLDFAVPSVFLPALKPGVRIIARASGFDQPFEGEISAISSQIDESSRAVMVRAILPNPDFRLRPGLLMTVELLKDPREAVVIPETAIIPEGRKAFVFVVDEAKQPAAAEKREVVIGARRPGEVEILQNLTPGEKVIVQGTMMARDGAPVQVKGMQARGETVKQFLAKQQTGGAPKAEGEKPDAAAEGSGPSVVAPAAGSPQQGGR